MENKEISALEQEKFDALQEFLLDIECLDSLTEWTKRFNLFDILKITRTEIRHSNMLAWLLNPNENHGLGDRVLRGLIRQTVLFSSTQVDILDTLLMDCYNFSILREWHNIDVLAVSHEEKFVLCIENKIDSGEHDNQLARYKKQIEQAFPEYQKKYIYLSPEGLEASDSENWHAMSYAEVLSVIESAMQQVNLLPEVQLLVNNYIDTIRRDIVGDERLARICAEIYVKHQKALDLIFENKPDRSMELAEIFRAWAMRKMKAGEIEYVPEKSGKTMTRFKTKAMSFLLPDAEEAKSGWGTKNYYFYEIRNMDGKEFFIQFSLSSKEIPAHLRAVCNRINEYFPSRQQKENWQWRTPFTTKHCKLEDLSEERINRELNKRFEEIRAFEEELKQKLTGDHV